MELAAVLLWNLFAGPRAPADVSDAEPASREGTVGMSCTPIGLIFAGSGSSSFLSLLVSSEQLSSGNRPAPVLSPALATHLCAGLEPVGGAVGVGEGGLYNRA